MVISACFFKENLQIDILFLKSCYVAYTPCHRFTHLRSLNLADNDLRCFPMAVCKMKMLTELNLASNKIEDIPPDITDLEK